MIDLVFYLPLFVLPFLAFRRDLWVLLALAAVGWLIVLGLQWVVLSGLAANLLGREETALHDTYYVVSHVHYSLGLIAVLLILALVARITRPAGRLAIAAFWLMHVSIIATVLPQLLTDLMFSEDTDLLAVAKRFETVNQVTTISTLIALLSLVALIVLLFFAGIRRIRDR